MGWTFAEIDQLTLWDVNELMEYWQANPPAHVILAAVHMKPGARRKRTNAKPSQMDDLRREVLQLGGGISNGPLPAVYRDK